LGCVGRGAGELKMVGLIVFSIMMNLMCVCCWLMIYRFYPERALSLAYILLNELVEVSYLNFY
jgi:hypothetical protein